MRMSRVRASSAAGRMSLGEMTELSGNTCAELSNFSRELLTSPSEPRAEATFLSLPIAVLPLTLVLSSALPNFSLSPGHRPVTAGGLIRLEIKHIRDGGPYPAETTERGSGTVAA